MSHKKSSRLKNFIIKSSMNSQNSNSLATSFKWVTFLTWTSATENGIWINWHFLFFSKKEDQNIYCLHISEMNSLSIINLGRRKGAPSKQKSLMYEYFSSRYSRPFPSRKSIDSWVQFSRKVPLRMALDLPKNASWIWYIWNGGLCFHYMR